MEQTIHSADTCIDLTRMECKVMIKYANVCIFISIDLTRMECKEVRSTLSALLHTRIDLTRMECKVSASCTDVSLSGMYRFNQNGM